MPRDRVTLRSVDGRTVLEWADPRLTRRNQFRCTAVLEDDGEISGVEVEMITPYRDLWLEFADDLVRDASGWAGLKEWQSEFGEFALACSNLGRGAIRVGVGLGRHEHDDWREASFDVDASELPRFRDDLRGFLRLDA